MAQTPEGRVKDALKKLLAQYNITPAKDAGAVPPDSTGWYYMPVGGPMSGVNGIPDFIGKFHGKFWAAETKAPGKKPTGFQKLQIEAINTSEGPCFVIDGDFTEFIVWLESIKADAQSELSW